jgi:hypothetical protein
MEKELWRGGIWELFKELLGRKIHGDFLAYKSYCTFKISYWLLLDEGAPTVGTPELQIVPASHLEE